MARITTVICINKVRMGPPQKMNRSKLSYAAVLLKVLPIFYRKLAKNASVTPRIIMQTNHQHGT